MNSLVFTVSGKGKAIRRFYIHPVEGSRNRCLLAPVKLG